MLESNVARNSALLRGKGTQPVIQELDWTSQDQLTSQLNAGYDVIIGSDVLITERDSRLLAQVLGCLTRAGGVTSIYLGSPVQRDGYRHLIENVTRGSLPWTDFRFEIVPESEMDSQYSSERIRVLRLTRKEEVGTGVGASAA